MGFLEVGTPLMWKDSLKYLEYVREHGIIQFLHVYNCVKDRSQDVLLWGDEIEYHLVQFDDEAKTVKIPLNAPSVLEILEKEEASGSFETTSAWHPEYGSWMIEATPGRPYGGLTSDLLAVEMNQRMRRQRITAALPSNVKPLSTVVFPMMGVGDYTVPSTTPGGRHTESSYVSDAVIQPHPRFGTLTENIRRRRGSKVCICLPLYRPDPEEDDPESAAAGAGSGESSSAAGAGGDVVPEPPSASSTSIESGSATLTEADAEKAADRACCPAALVEKADGSKFVRVAGAADRAGSCSTPCDSMVHMDAMAFGMGCCCLQVTFQARDIKESRYLYDQLSVLSPILMALSAATPFYKGRIVDVDTRWDIIASSVDCRTPAERGLSGEPLEWQTLPDATKAAGAGRRRIYKSRYDSIDCFISDAPTMKDKYNDEEIVMDEGAYKRLLEGGVDERLARHIAHLFIRDPLVIFKERIEVNDTETTEHFENIQSTNWQNVRWKPPPANSTSMGWRVELRTMEVQLTDFENAAFTVFSTLITRVILFFNLNLYIPISKVDENMAVARKRDAVNREKFYFRKSVIPLPEKCGSLEPLPDSEDPDAYSLMTIDEILMGTGSHFPGLMPLVFAYLDIIACDADSRMTIESYMRLIVDRAQGTLPTGASWLRELALNHPKYKGDAVLSQEMAYDILKKCNEVATGEDRGTELLGSYRPAVHTEPLSPTSVPPPRGRRMRGASFSEEVFTSEQCAVVRSLVQHYTVRSTFKDTPAFLRFPEAPSAAADGGAAGGGAAGGGAAGSSD